MGDSRSHCACECRILLVVMAAALVVWAFQHALYQPVEGSLKAAISPCAYISHVQASSRKEGNETRNASLTAVPISPSQTRDFQFLDRVSNLAFDNRTIPKEYCQNGGAHGLAHTVIIYGSSEVPSLVSDQTAKVIIIHCSRNSAFRGRVVSRTDASYKQAIWVFPVVGTDYLYSASLRAGPPGVYDLILEHSFEGEPFWTAPGRNENETNIVRPKDGVVWWSHVLCSHAPPKLTFASKTAFNVIAPRQSVDSPRRKCSARLSGLSDGYWSRNTFHPFDCELQLHSGGVSALAEFSRFARSNNIRRVLIIGDSTMKRTYNTFKDNICKSGCRASDHKPYVGLQYRHSFADAVVNFTFNLGRPDVVFSHPDPEPWDVVLINYGVHYHAYGTNSSEQYELTQHFFALCQNYSRGMAVSWGPVGRRVSTGPLLIHVTTNSVMEWKNNWNVAQCYTSNQRNRYYEIQASHLILSDANVQSKNPIRMIDLNSWAGARDDFHAQGDAVHMRAQGPKVEYILLHVVNEIQRILEHVE
jgi:hypothetical protein